MKQRSFVNAEVFSEGGKEQRKKMGFNCLKKTQVNVTCERTRAIKTRFFTTHADFKHFKYREADVVQ